YSDKEWKAFETEWLAKRKAEKKKELEDAGEKAAADTAEVEEELGPDHQKLWEFEHLAKIAERLKKLGYELALYDRVPGENTKPLFTVQAGSAENEEYGLGALL